MLNISDAGKRSRLKGLYEYLNQNQDYIVNYEERKGLGKTFTTQVTESHIESIINVRHKRVERCNGVGKGAQRSSNPIIQQNLIGQWQQAVLSALGAGITHIISY